MPSLRSHLLIASALLLAIALSVAGALLLPTPLADVLAPGVYLEIEINLILPIELPYLPLDPEDFFITCVLIEAVHPGPPDRVFLGSGCYLGEPLVRIPYETLRSTVEAWAETLRARGVAGERYGFAFGMIVTIAVVDVINRVAVIVAHDSVPLELDRLTKPRFLFYKLTIYRGTYNIVVQEKRPTLFNLLKALGAETLSNASRGGEFEELPVAIRRKKEVLITPENLRLALPESYFRTYGNGVFVKTPTLLGCDYAKSHSKCVH